MIQNTGRILIHGLFQKKRMILGLNIGILATILLGSLLWQPTYEASSSVIIRGRDYEAPLFPQSRSDSPWTILMNPKDEINSEIEIMRSRPVMEQVVASLKLDERRDIPDPGFWGGVRGVLRSLFRAIRAPFELVGLVKEPSPEEAFEKAVMRLSKRIDVEPAVESQIIRISYRDPDPSMAAQVVNQAVAAYLNQHLAINLNRTQGSFFAEQIQEFENKLNDLQAQQVALKSETGILSFAEQSKALLDKFNTFDVARTTIQKEIISRRSKVEKVEQIRKANPSLLIPLPEIAQDIQIQDLENKYINLRYDLSRVGERYTDDSRQLVTLRKELSEVEKQIRAQVSELLARDMAELSKLEAEEQAISRTLERLREDISALPAKEVALRNIEKEIEDKESVLSTLRKKYQDSLVSQATDFRLENAKVVSPAAVPIKRATPNLPLNLALGLLFSLVISFSLAFLLQYWDDSLNVPEDVERNLGLQVVASIPEF